MLLLRKYKKLGKKIIISNKKKLLAFVQCFPVPLSPNLNVFYIDE